MELLKERVRTSRLLGQDEYLVLHGGGNTSVKIDGILWVKGSGWDLGTIEEGGFAPVRMDALLDIAQKEMISDSELVRLQKEGMTNKEAPAPSIEAVVHAIIPYRFVDHTHADAVVTISNTPKGREVIEKIYGEKVVVVDYVMPGFILSKAIAEAVKGREWSEIEGIVLLNHGIFSFDEDGEASYQKMLALVKKAADYLEQNAKIDDGYAKSEISEATKEALKIEISALRGCESVIACIDTACAKMLSCAQNLEEILCGGPLTPEHVIRTKPRAVSVEEGRETECVRAYADWYGSYFEANNDGTKIILDKAPRWGVVKGKGVFVAAKDEKEAKILKDIISHTIDAMLRAVKLGDWKSLCERDIFAIEYWELEQAKLKK
jgi:rhamnose utilization protein RhaD (predicted bifunctional aldolase and dehydrogenase)